MENRYLKTWVYTGVLTVLVITLIGLTAGISSMIFKSVNKSEDTYVLQDIVETYTPVAKVIETEVMNLPYSDETVETLVNYYEKDADTKEQEDSIILYENTYMPSTGILYGASSAFNVTSVLKGEVTNITKDEVFGTIIEIKHSNNLVSKYSSLTNADVSIGDTVQPGEVIGTSGLNKAVSVSKNMLLFELIYNGEYVNPNNYFNKTISE